MSNLLRALSFVAALLLAVTVRAQTDEIQVYDATIAEPGKAELTVHNNYTPNGRRDPDFSGGVTPNRSLNGAFEFAYGYADFWELGLYLPVYTLTNQGDLDYEGAKLRTLFVVPHARTREFFYGVNVEYSYNQPRWSQTRTGLEVRPIVGWHEGPWDFILNPIVDSNFDGLGRAHFEPAERVAYNASRRWTFALEEYADLGRLHRFNAPSQESQSLFVVIDYNASENNSFEFGAGFGLTAETDRLVLKLIWNHAL